MSISYDDNDYTTGTSTLLDSLMELILIFIRLYIIKLATVVEDNPKVPFSIATTLRCRAGHYHQGARGLMVIVVGTGHDDTSSNPGRD